jgi:wobble nucleotide-excising tRNase
MRVEVDMKPVPSLKVKKWADFHGNYAASSVSGICPKCHQKVLFALSQHNSDAVRDTIASTAICPDCDKKVHFWTVKPRNARRNDNGTVYMHPTAPDYHESKDFGVELSDALKKSYHSTVDSYNSQNFIATAVGCRRTLEGLFKFLLGAAGQSLSLAAAIEEATKTTDFAKPLTSLAHSIRHGGNLAAHFDDNKEPTKEMARAMVELLEQILITRTRIRRRRSSWRNRSG